MTLSKGSFIDVEGLTVIELFIKSDREYSLNLLNEKTQTFLSFSNSDFKNDP